MKTLLVAILLLSAGTRAAHATYAADFALAQSTTFQNQVQMSAIKAAIAIANEAATTHPNLDSKRHALSTTVLTNFSQALIVQFSMAVIEAGGLVTGATDAQVDAQMSAVWNAIAGVSSHDSTNVS